MPTTRMKTVTNILINRYLIIIIKHISYHKRVNGIIVSPAPMRNANGGKSAFNEAG